ncbi:DUF885 domain-containing protein [Aliikangiella maris]|uniref:DUF885 domain-containing protein n=2 Tax=Aliikangiella maris TaxID=3162458 RepID=A0ABV2BPN4_9GAMM
MKQLIILGLVASSIISLYPERVVAKDLSVTQSHETSQQLHQIFEREWQARAARNPLKPNTKKELSKSDLLLMDVSPAAYEKWAEQSREFLKQLEAIDYQKLSQVDQINYQIFSRQLNHRIAEITYKTYQIPFLSDSGFHTEMMNLHLHSQFKTVEDYQEYIQLLASIPAYFSQNIDNMKAGLKRKYSMPKVVMQGFTQVIESVYKSKLETNNLWQPFTAFPAHFSPSEKAKLIQQGRAVLNDLVFPAFKKLKVFFEDEYIPNTRHSLAAYELPNGKAYYQMQVEHFSTLELTADEIHQIGLDEVARIRGEMETIIKQLEFKGDFKDFLAYLRTEPKFYAKTPLELIKQASYLAKKMDGQLPKLFKRLPRQPYTVEPVPESIAPKYTTGRYIPAPLESERSGAYWVNTYALDKRPLYVLEALTLHEAVPGHHLQVALNRELDNLPEFRRHSYISAFGEGWGLYSEKLGLEVGFYQDPYSNFGRLTYEMWRAARLVIDTGIHAKGWTREQSIKLLAENSALSMLNITTEVDRYISWPGQALSYKLGELKILALRSKAEESLGQHFDIREFHDEILRYGSLPLKVLESQIMRYIESKLTAINAEGA